MPQEAGSYESQTVSNCRTLQNKGIGEYPEAQELLGWVIYRLSSVIEACVSDKLFSFPLFNS